MIPYTRQIAEIGRQFPRSEVKKLLVSSDIRGALSVLTTYALIGAALALALFRPFALTVPLALCLLGGRQLALAILTHEAAHRTLFASRGLNERVGKWLCAYPMGIDLELYRAEHMKHHVFTGEPGDPDLGLVRPYPVTPASLARKLLRDLLGVTGVKRVFYLLLMDLEIVTYSLSTNVHRIDQSGRRARDHARAAWAHLHGPIATHLVGFGVLWMLGVPRLYLLWMAAYLSPFSLFLRVRSIAEHACTPEPGSVLLGTRTTHASPLARLTVAPHRVNFHLEHHLFMQVPHYNLPALHRLLARQGVLEKGCTARNYWEVLKAAGSKS